MTTSQTLRYQLTLIRNHSEELKRLCLGKTDAEIRRRGPNDDKNATRRCCDRLFLSSDAGRELCSQTNSPETISLINCYNTTVGVVWGIGMLVRRSDSGAEARVVV